MSKSDEVCVVLLKATSIITAALIGFAFGQAYQLDEGCEEIQVQQIRKEVE